MKGKGDTSVIGCLGTNNIWVRDQRHKNGKSTGEMSWAPNALIRPSASLLAAFFGRHATLPRKDSVLLGGALRDIQKRAASVTIPGRELFQY